MSSDEASPRLDEEPEPQTKDDVVTQGDVSEGLSQLARTADGLSYAFVRLELKGKQKVDISPIKTFVHLRYVDLSSNNIQSLSPLNSLPYLVSLNLEGNGLVDVNLTSSNTT
jgi:hypothetical protein